METKFVFLNLAPPAFFFVFLFFCFFPRLVSRYLPDERLLSWKLFCTGFFIGIAGLSIAVYFMRVEIGAFIGIVGAVVSAIGLAKFFGSR